MSESEKRNILVESASTYVHHPLNKSDKLFFNAYWRDLVPHHIYAATRAADAIRFRRNFQAYVENIAEDDSINSEAGAGPANIANTVKEVSVASDSDIFLELGDNFVLVKTRFDVPGLNPIELGYTIKEEDPSATTSSSSEVTGSEKPYHTLSDGVSQRSQIEDISKSFGARTNILSAKIYHKVKPATAPLPKSDEVYLSVLAANPPQTASSDAQFIAESLTLVEFAVQHEDFPGPLVETFVRLQKKENVQSDLSSNLRRVVRDRQCIVFSINSLRLSEASGEDRQLIMRQLSQLEAESEKEQAPASNEEIHQISYESGAGALGWLGSIFGGVSSNSKAESAGIVQDSSDTVRGPGESGIPSGLTSSETNIDPDPIVGSRLEVCVCLELHEWMPKLLLQNELIRAAKEIKGIRKMVLDEAAEATQRT